MSSGRNVERGTEEFSRVYKKYDEEKDVLDEGVFVSEFVNDDDDEDDDAYDYIQAPRTAFEKCLSKIDDDLRQSEQDTQFLSHDLVSVYTAFLSLQPYYVVMCCISIIVCISLITS